MHFKEQTVSPDYISDRGINEKLINRSIKAYSTLTFSCLSIQLQPSSDVNGIYFVMILYVYYFLQFLLLFFAERFVELPNENVSRLHELYAPGAWPVLPPM